MFRKRKMRNAVQTLSAAKVLDKRVLKAAKTLLCATPNDLSIILLNWTPKIWKWDDRVAALERAKDAMFAFEYPEKITLLMKAAQKRNAIAIETLGRLREPSAQGLLLALLEQADLEPIVTRAVLRALGDFGNVSAVPLLITYLKRDEFVREAALALGKLPDRNGADALLAALSTCNTYPDAAAVATALGQVGDARALDPIIVIVQRLNLSNHSLPDFLRAIGLFRNDRAVEFLTRILNSGDAQYQAEDLQTLNTILAKDKPLSAFVTAQDISEALDSSAKSAEQSRCAAAFALREIGTPEALRHLKDAAGNKNVNIASAAMQAIKKIERN